MAISFEVELAVHRLEARPVGKGSGGGDQGYHQLICHIAMFWLEVESGRRLQRVGTA